MTREQIPREPTSDECTANAVLGDGWFAIWYPSMGGYVSHAVVKWHEGGCCDLYVWHDGQFPFSDDGSPFPGEERKTPAKLHHCDPEQFIHFGETIKKLRCD